MQDRIKQTLPQYAPKLWSMVKPTYQQPSTNLVNQDLQSPDPIYLVSDASLNNQKRGAFSWMIATKTQELWNGSGVVPWPQHDAHSGQTEGYGLLAGFAFLEHYFIQTQVTNDWTRATIRAYCDNLGLIEQITKMQTSQIPNPNGSTENDYNLHVKILQMIKCLLLRVSLFHVKGHQDDDTPTDQLPYKAQLNIQCNEQACQNLAMLLTNTKPHPMLPATYPHLYINNQAIVRQILDYLRESHLLPTYKAYLTSKFLWQWQESHRNAQSLCESLVLFSSCGTLSTGPRTDHEPLPNQTTFSPHNRSMTLFTKFILIAHQWQLTPSTNRATSPLQDHIIIKSYFERSPVGFLQKSTGNWSKSWVQA